MLIKRRVLMPVKYRFVLAFHWARLSWAGEGAEDEGAEECSEAVDDAVAMLEAEWPEAERKRGEGKKRVSRVFGARPSAA